MRRSIPRSGGRLPLLPVLCAAALFALLPGCARGPATTAASPEAAPEESETAADLTSNKVSRRPNEKIADLLETRTPGVRVRVNPDGSLSGQIHGPNSFMAGNTPLYVVDGSPVRMGPNGTLRGISPHEIESIEVLKFPPETSLYGVQGANGVVVITTLRP